MTSSPDSSRPTAPSSDLSGDALAAAILRSKFAGDDLRGNLPKFPFRPSLTPLPAAAPRQGRVVYIPGAAGVADALWICMKSAADTYSWVELDTAAIGATVAGLQAVDFLVGTASALLSSEIVVGTTPGGELGGTWASPKVDTTHSGSAHDSALPEFLVPLLPSEATSSVAAAQSANQAYFTPFVPLQAGATITKLVGAIGTQNGNIDVGVYSFDGTTMTKVVTLGSTACPAASTFVSFDIADTLLARGTRYFAAYATDSATMKIAKINLGLNTIFIPTNGPFWTKASSFPLPTTVTSLTAVNQGPLLIGQLSGGSTF